MGANGEAMAFLFLQLCAEYEKNLKKMQPASPRDSPNKLIKLHVLSPKTD